MENIRVDVLSEYQRIKLSLDLPQNFKLSKNLWSRVLFDSSGFKKITLPSGCILEKDDLIFITSLLNILTLIFQLIRLPIFHLPRIISIPLRVKSKEEIQFTIEFPKIEYINNSIYRIAIKTAVDVSSWIGQNHPTQDNIEKVFKLIEKGVNTIIPHIPGGKSTIPVLKVANDLNIPFTHLGMGVYQIGWGSKARRMDRSTCDQDSAIGSKLSSNKIAAAALLRDAGIPSPTHGVVNKLNEAYSLAEKIGFPVVIKPVDCERGEGVTVNVFDEQEVKLAFNLAYRLSRSKKVIVERQVSGVCHRVFIANDKLLYSVKRNPISVFGDGASTIEQLVRREIDFQKKLPPWKRSELKEIDEISLITLERMGKTTKDIPGRGEVVNLRPIETTEWGGFDEDVTSIIHSENIRIALKAAKLFGLKIAGIDIISPDISKPWHENGAIVNEVNFAPLFGGAEISRSYIKKFFTEFLDGDGRIPVIEVKDEKEAMDFHREKNKQGYRCFFTSSTKTIDFIGRELMLPFNSLKKRIKALIMCSEVDLIVFYVKGNTLH